MATSMYIIKSFFIPFPENLLKIGPLISSPTFTETDSSLY